MTVAAWVFPALSSLVALVGLCWLVLMHREQLERVNMLNRLISITEAALDAPDLPAALNALARTMASLSGASNVYIALWDGDRAITKPVAAWGPHQAEYLSMRFASGENTLTRLMAERGQTLVVKNRDGLEGVSRQLLDQFPAASYLALRLVHGGRLLGSLILSYEKPQRLRPRQISLCESAARTVSFALDKERLLDDERQRSGELLALNRIGTVLASGRGIREVSAALLEQCKRIIDLDAFYIALYDDSSGELSFPLFYDDGDIKTLPTRRLSDGPGMCGYIIAERGSLYIPDADQPEMVERYHILRAGGEPSRSFIGVPLLHGGRALGVLSVQSTKADAYSSKQVQLLETVAAQAAIAIENARLYEELTWLSSTDGLTGIFNFRTMSELGSMEFSKAKRMDRDLSVLFMDVDNFSEFNRRYGHLTGNTVLVEVARATKSAIRTMDVFARYGGEEFVLVLPETPPDAAYEVAERIRQSVERSGVSGPSGEHIGVTVSIGVTSLLHADDSFQQMIDRANQAERRAKQLGRNRVVREMPAP
ncbi:MAG TPA: diguanylate cyclase [Spirochaetales bacterium]|nr:diguanylate cyclase [Spirochaetales bacterium]